MKERMLVSWPFFVALSCAFITMAASDDKIPSDVKERPDFYAKMDMVENLTAMTSLEDKDIEVVMNTANPLPAAAKLEELPEKPGDKDEDTQ